MTVIFNSRGGYNSYDSSTLRHYVRILTNSLLCLVLQMPTPRENWLCHTLLEGRVLHHPPNRLISSRPAAS